MVISGTHALDIVMWMMAGKRPVEIYARSVDKALGPEWKGIDATAGMITFADGSVYHLNISWALPVTWPGAVYSLDVGIVGTTGVLTIDDTHRDIVLAVSKPQSEGYAPDKARLVDFLGSYPPGDIALGELRGPMREETDAWLNRVCAGWTTQHASAAEAHIEPGADEGDGPVGTRAPRGVVQRSEELEAMHERYAFAPAGDAGDAAAVPSLHAQGERYPNKPMRMIVPFAPGGASDFVARVLQPRLAALLGQAVVIDNKPGAAGNIGMEAAATARPTATRCSSATSARWRSTRRSSAPSSASPPAPSCRCRWCRTCPTCWSPPAASRPRR